MFERIKRAMKPSDCFLSFSIINIFIMLCLIGGLKEKAIHIITYKYSNMGDFWSLFEIMNLNPGEYYDNYPPLAYVFLKLFYVLINRDNDVVTRCENASLVIVLYIVLFYVLFFSLINTYVKLEHNKKNIMIIVLSLSYPVFWCGVERGNMVLYSALFLMLGYFWSQSESKIKREVGLLLIACSADMKVYPAVLGLMFLADKRYKESIRLIIYGVAFFVIPLLMMNTTFSAFYDSTFGLTLGRGIYSKTSIVGNIVLIMGKERVIIGWILTIVWMLWAAVYVFIEKERWKCLVMIISYMTIIIPESYVYNYIFIVLPLIIFLNKKEEYKKMDYVYAILFALVFTCPPLVPISSGVMIGMYFSWIAILFLLSIEKIQQIIIFMMKRGNSVC